MQIAHFYHVWAAGSWASAAQEHTTALAAANFPVRPRVGVVGPGADREAFRGWATAHDWQIAAEADEGYEQLTLSAMRSWALQSREPAVALYAHTKGARTDLGGSNTRWRQEMTRRLVGEWPACIQLLGRHDTVGCCWKNKAEFPGLLTGYPITGWYAGNFWWATRDYLRKLPEPTLADRHDAEAWIGMASPDPVDMLPGWMLHLTADGSVITAQVTLGD